MDDLQETLSAVLNDPKELERLTQMASSLLGGGEASAPEPSSDLPALPDITQLLSRVKSGGSSDTQKLLEAMKPFLAEKRRAKLDKAIRVARMASVAELALGQMGGEEHD